VQLADPLLAREVGRAHEDELVHRRVRLVAAALGLLDQLRGELGRRLVELADPVGRDRALVGEVGEEEGALPVRGRQREPGVLVDGEADVGRRAA
jgi:hypothetical protein